MDGDSWHCTGDRDPGYLQKKEMQKGKMVVWGGLTNSHEKKRSERQREKERYTHLNAEFQRTARRDKETFLRDQCKEINQSYIDVDHLVMSMCRVFSCVVGRGCLLWPVHFLGKTLLVFALLHSVFQGQICLLLHVFLDFLLLHSSPL